MVAMNENPIEILRQRLTGKTQKQFADEFGISQAYISDVLCGRREPGEKILDALDLERVTAYQFKKKSRRSAA